VKPKTPKNAAKSPAGSKAVKKVDPKANPKTAQNPNAKSIAAQIDRLCEATPTSRNRRCLAAAVLLETVWLVLLTILAVVR
jgi:hypothetical protein